MSSTANIHRMWFIHGNTLMLHNRLLTFWSISIKGVHMIFFYVCVFSQWPHPHVSVFIWIAAADFLKTINILMSPVWENTQTECLFKKQKRCVVVRLHILGAGVASSIPMQYPVRVLARPFMLQTKGPGMARLRLQPVHNTDTRTSHCMLYSVWSCMWQIIKLDCCCVKNTMWIRCFVVLNKAWVCAIYIRFMIF